MPTYRGADGAVLHYDLVGAGRPLVALHGGAGAHPRYLGDLGGLGREHEIVVPHLRGVGESAAAPLGEHGSRWAQADDLDALRAARGLDTLTLVGHSAGTRLAIAYAAAFPDRLAGLVLITPPTAYLVDVDAPDLAELRMDDPVFAAATAAFETGPDVTDDDTFNEWQQAIAPRGYGRWDDTTRAHAARMWFSLAAARDYFIGDGPPDLHDRLRALTVPVLVVAGDADVGVSVPAAAAVAELFPRGRLVVVEGSGHFPWVEQPERFRAAVDPFLAATTA